MSDITRQQAIDWLCRLRSFIPIYIPRNKADFENALTFAINSLETDEAYQLLYERSTNKAHWIDDGPYMGRAEHIYRCSSCGCEYITVDGVDFEYCPICGSKMEDPDEEH